MRKKIQTGASSCEFRIDPVKTKRPNVPAFYKHRQDFSWTGVSDEPYKTGGSDWANIIRRVLIGSHDETTRFHVRYFEISSGGNSSLEKHHHEHVVICLKGKGTVLIGDNKKTMKYLDTVYISPDTPHQLSNPFTEPFGFLCIVNAKRDRPKLLAKKCRPSK
jgi:ribulose-bisphosphate carboxylase large chain